MSNMKLEEILTTMKLLYPNSKRINDQYITYSDDSNVYICNDKGEIVIEGLIEDTTIVGTFVAELSVGRFFGNVKVTNLLTGKSISFNSTRGAVHGYTHIGTDLIVVSFDDTMRIYNKNFKLMYESCNIYINNGNVRDTATTTAFSLFCGKWCSMYYNKEIEKIVRYDSIEAGGIETIGTSYIYNRKNMVTKLKYKLMNNCKAVGNEYDTIVKPIELRNTPYVLIINESKCGIMNMTGNEVLSPIYKNVSYLGNNTFLISGDTTNAVISLNRGLTVIAGPSQPNRLYQHPLLPCVVQIEADNIYLIHNVLGKFPASDIAKYMECSYLKSDPTIIRVKVGEVYKYIDNRLTPIVNILKIRRYNALIEECWQKM